MNNGKNVLRDKSYALATKIVQLYQEIVKQKKEFVLSKQIFFILLYFLLSTIYFLRRRRPPHRLPGIGHRMEGDEFGGIGWPKDVAAVEDGNHPPLRTGAAHPNQNVSGKHVTPHRHQIADPLKDDISFH